MTQEHPITPPSELVEKWYEAIDNSSTSWKQELTTQAARWGADQELDACCEHLTRWAAWEPEDVKEFCDLRRPKLPTLKEQALDAFAGATFCTPEDKEIILRALESLPE